MQTLIFPYKSKEQENMLFQMKSPLLLFHIKARIRLEHIINRVE